MAEDMRPASPGEAPDPANAYERAHPQREAGMGRLDNNDDAVPTSNPDQQHQAVPNRQDPRQINAHEVTNARQGDDPNNPDRGAEPDHSMHEEEPLDEGPVENVNPRFRRHPRTEGKGGTP